MTDVEGSSRLWEQDSATMSRAVARHDLIANRVIPKHSGNLVKSRGEGDSLFTVFEDATNAIIAAVDLLRALAEDPGTEMLRVRIGIHSGITELRDGDFFGSVLNRCGRIRGIGHGGQILLSEATAVLVKDHMPPGMTLSDLGLHGLKDLSRPEHIFQLNPDSTVLTFPSLKSLDAVINNLPRQTTSFVGRELDLAKVNSFLGTHPLISIVGSGGSGKTRFALQLSADVAEKFPHGVWLFELASVASSAQVAKAMLGTMSLREELGFTIEQTITESLKGGPVLIILDNCEHVREGATAMVAALLSGCSNLQILVTSREPLGISGELTYRLDPLATPDLEYGSSDEWRSSPAVALFLDRARLALPTYEPVGEDFSAIAKICHQMDGIPLALELAAARIKSMPVQDIATRLESNFRMLASGNRTTLPRQQTLRALVDWSYQLLTETEKAVFRSAAVFVGGWSLEAAEHVCARPDMEAWEVTEALAALAEKSLFVFDPDRLPQPYHLLETVRQYALEQLENAGEVAGARRRHAYYYGDVAATAQRMVTSYDQIYAKRSLTIAKQADNIFAAHTWSALDPDLLSLNLDFALSMFWITLAFARFSEGAQIVSTALHVAGEPHAQIRAKLQMGYAALSACLLQGDPNAEEILQQAIEFFRADRDDDCYLPLALMFRGRIAAEKGNVEGAWSLIQESLHIARERDRKLPIVFALLDAGTYATASGDHLFAEEAFVEGIALCREAGDFVFYVSHLARLAELRCVQNRSNESLGLYVQCLTTSLKIGHIVNIIRAIMGIAELGLQGGRSDVSTLLLGALKTQAERSHAKASVFDVRRMSKLVEQASSLESEAFPVLFEKGRRLKVEAAAQAALALAVELKVG